jgi:hypothetical protein
MRQRAAFSPVTPELPWLWAWLASDLAVLNGSTLPPGAAARDKIFDRAHETKDANLSYAAEILRNRPELCNGFCYGIFSV